MKHTARISRNFGRWVLATTFLGLAVAGQPVASAAATTLQDEDAEALIQGGHWKRARAILEPEVHAHPQDPTACYLLAETKTSFNDLDGALPLAQRAVELDGQNSEYHLELGQIFGKMAARASALSAGPLALKFRRQVQMALQLDPRNLDALDTMMLFKFQAPLLMGGDKAEAAALSDRMTLLNASEGYLAHAELAGLEGNPGQVEDYLRQAVHANARNYSALTTLAEFYSDPAHAKYDEARNFAQRALRLDPQQVAAHWILARIAARREQWGELDPILAAAEKAVPDDLRPFYEAAHVLLETGKDLPRAEGYAKAYLSQEPEGGEPDAADAHRLLGLILEREGRRTEARAEIQIALRLRPNFKAAKDDLKRLEGR